MYLQNDPFLIALDTFCVNIGVKYSYINSGGCGVFAALLSRELNRFTGITIKLRVYNGEWGDPVDIDKARINANMTAREWHSNRIEFSHILVELGYNNKLYLIDSDGILSGADAEYNLCPGSLTLEEIYSISIHNDYGWNSFFDRDQIPNMRRSFSCFVNAMEKAARRN